MRPYGETTGSDLLRDLKARIARLERGSVKNRIPEYDEPPPDDVEDVPGARLYVYQGQLFARVGGVDYELTPAAAAPAPAPEP